MSEQNSDPSRPFDPPAAPSDPPAPPQAPPAPPAAPEPQRPEVPKYGEYAENPYGVPGYPAASQAAAPAAPMPPAPPAPAYGVPAYGAPGYGAPGYGAPAYAAPVRKRRTWDVVLTIVLLALGLIGLLIGLVYAAVFANPDLLDQAMQQQGYDGFSAQPGAAPAVLAVSHIVLFLVAVGLSIPLLIRGRMVVFWIPLTIGVIAAIIFWVTVFAVVTSDPSFMSRYGA